MNPVRYRLDQNSNKGPIFFILAAAVVPLYIYHNPANWKALAYNYYAFAYALFPATYVTHAGEFLFIAWFWIVGHGVGKFLAVKGLRHAGPLPLTLTAPAGWGAVSFIFFALALLQLFTFPVILAVCVLLTLGFGVPAVLQALPEWKKIGDLPARWRALPLDLRAALVLLAVPLLYAFYSCLLPPTQSDGLRYHLAVPLLYLRHGGFYLMPHLAFSNFPFLIEYLYAIPLAFGLISGPKFIHASFYLLTVLLVNRLGRTLAGPRAGIYAALILASMPFAPIFASWSFMEFALAFYTLLGFSLALEVFESRRAAPEAIPGSTIRLLGLVGGYLLGCKYTAVTTVAFFMLLLPGPAWTGFRRAFTPRNLKSSLRPVLWFGAVAALVGCPWYIKNYILLGNPVYPFARGLFPTPDWTGFNALFFQYHAGLKGNLTAITQAPVFEQVYDFLTLPFRVTFYPGDMESHPENFGSWPIGVVWLLLGPFLLLRRGWTPRAAWHLAFSVFLYVLWAYTYRDTRFLLPGLAVAAPLMGLLVEELAAASRWTKYGILLAVFYNILFTSASILLPTKNAPWWVMSGQVSREDYLENVSDFTRGPCQAFRYLREHTAPEEKVLLHGIEHPFYCPNDFIGADWFNTDPLIAWSWERPSAEALLARLREAGIRYIAYDRGKINTPGYFGFYRLFRLPLEKGEPLLRELYGREYTRLRFPYAYNQWLQRFTQRLEEAERQSPNIQALETLLDGGMLPEIFRSNEHPAPPGGGVLILRVSEK
ncbi:MAG TPA: hypothetical protein PK360_03870 [bacterium]|nr:hypothetical protein [bacterium]